MFKVKVLFQGNKSYFKTFYSYRRALNFVFKKQSNYSSYLIGYIFDQKNQLEIQIAKNGYMSCLSKIEFI